MFTGIVQERANAVFDGARLVVHSAVEADVGDSVAIDGVCLTVSERTNGRLSFDVMPETLALVKRFGESVNVEPALRIGDPLGGHYVQGHVDAVGRVRAVEPDRNGHRITIEAPPEILRYCVDKGSIAVDGVALTITSLADDAFEVALVPHTLEVTTFGVLVAGDEVNLEVDVLAKYVERLVNR
jgi:riboflavin synthase alpha subunit